ncbi:MAG: zinc-dependent metalloprotease [bacterium]
MLIPDEIAREVSGGLAHSAAELTDEQVKLANPFGPPGSAMKSISDRVDRLAARAVEPADYLFNDGGLWQFAQQHMELDRDGFKQVIREQAFRATTLHELGHNMGLRHNFIASFDRANFFPEYYQIKKQVNDELGAEPVFVPFQENDETPEAFAERYAEWDAQREVRLARETELGIRNYRYSSIMDYSGLLYNDWNGLGSYDKAAMRFLHAGLVDQSECEGGIDRCATAARTQVQWYQGGELCEANGDCPTPPPARPAAATSASPATWA